VGGPSVVPSVQDTKRETGTTKPSKRTGLRTGRQDEETFGTCQADSALRASLDLRSLPMLGRAIGPTVCARQTAIFQHALRIDRLRVQRRVEELENQRDPLRAAEGLALRGS
jgi:hypothetical protein